MDRMMRIICLGILAGLAAAAQTTQARAPYLRQAEISQSGGTLRINANSPRPLEQALDALQVKYGWTIDYEDPQYLSSLDLVDAPPPSQAKLPSGGSFSVEFSASAPDEEKTLRLLVDSYNKSKNPGKFELRKDGQGNFSVVGNAAHDDKGGMSQQKPILDVPITVATEERPITDTVNLICQEISTQSHMTVELGVSPRKLMDHPTVKLGGSKVPARELLVQALHATHQNVYWRLLYDPGTKGYLLDLHGRP
jgi:hypothetical protein